MRLLQKFALKHTSSAPLLLASEGVHKAAYGILLPIGRHLSKLLQTIALKHISSTTIAGIGGNVQGGILLPIGSGHKNSGSVAHDNGYNVEQGIRPNMGITASNRPYVVDFRGKRYDESAAVSRQAGKVLAI